jgi:catechol 2,3-dioxygenase-like lactoylglutathione lyase family enzyme
MRLRQVVLAAADRDEAVEHLRAVLGLAEGFRDPAVGAFGLHNEVMTLGDTFLEVVSPVQPGTSAGRFLERRGGDGGYMLMFQTDDFAAARRRVDAQGVRVVLDVNLAEITEMHLHPQDLPGAIVAVSEARPPASWKWGGPGWQSRAKAGVVDRAMGAEIEARDPVALAERWGSVLGLPLERQGDAAALPLAGGGRLRFVPLGHLARDGIIAFDLRATDAAQAIEAANRRGLPVATGSRAVSVAGTLLRLV